MSHNDLMETVEDLLTNSCQENKSSLDAFSVLSVYLFLGEESNLTSLELEETLRKWFSNLESDRLHSTRSSIDKATTHESLATRLKYYFLGTCLSSLMILYPRTLRQLGPDLSKAINRLVGYMQTDMPNEAFKFVPLVYSLYSSLPEVDYCEGLSNYLASWDVFYSNTA